MLATSENGFYYYYTYLYPTIDMFQDDEKDDHFASVFYDGEKGAAKISWTKDNAYPPASKGVEITEYGTYIANGKKFPLKAYKISEDGYMTYYHKGSEILNINPLHDFQISFTVNKVLKGLDKITIDPLIAFNNTQNVTVISLSIEDNIIELMEDNITIKSSKNTIIETVQSFIDWDDDDTHKNQIFHTVCQKLQIKQEIFYYLQMVFLPQRNKTCLNIVSISIYSLGLQKAQMRQKLLIKLLVFIM